MDISLLNKQFLCHQTLDASDLNSITGKIDDLINYINNNEDGWSLELEVIPVDPGLTTVEPTVQVLAFKGYSSQSAANSDFTDNDRKNENLLSSNRGWLLNPNSINSDLILFEIIGLKRGNDMIPYEGTNYWQGPFRIGSSNTTSTTGTDDDKYNYIYCRTLNGNPSNIHVPLNDSNYWDSFVKLIEANPELSFATTDNNLSSGEEINYNSTYDRWTDHPLGITENIKYEWQIGLTKGDNKKWNYSFGPVCISHWGKNGSDGDGFEYIFYLGQTSDDVPTLTSTYTGKYRNPNYGKGTPIDNRRYIEVETDHPFGIDETVNGIKPYLQDDFIPTDWYDEPQAVDNVRSRQYVSTRKKQGGQESSTWEEFTQPKLWNVYASDGSKATLTNDTVFIDDNTSISALKTISKTIPLLWNGDEEIENFTVEINKSNEDTFIRNDSPLIKVGYINTSNTLVEVEWGTSGININSVKNKEFYIIKQNPDSESLPVGTEQVIFTLSGGGKTATRVLTFLVKDFNSGQAYLLIVTPNTLGIEHSNINDNTSSYTFRDSPSLTIKAVSVTSNELPVNENLYYGNRNSISAGGLYVKILGSNNNPIGSVSGSGTLELTCNLSSGVTPMDNNTKHIIVDLYYRALGNDESLDVKVDTETVDFSIKGDKGAEGNTLVSNGYSTSVINLYRRSSTDISGIAPYNLSVANGKIESNYNYKFSTQKLYATNDSNFENPLSTINGWSLNVPTSDGNPCYMTCAHAYSDLEYDSIENLDWAECIKYNLDGLNGINTALVLLFKRSSSNNITAPSSPSWWKFSTSKLHKNSTCTNEVSNSNPLDGWVPNIPETNGDPCYVILATALSTTDVDQINSWSTPVKFVLDGNEVGETGKMFYMMGVWDPEKEYSIDDLRIPIVFYDDGETNSSGNTGHYYYLNPELSENSIGNIPGKSTFGDNKQYWIKANDFGLVITEGIFSEFAKLGSAVISGDYIMSQHGKVENYDETSVTIDNSTSNLNNRPGYTYFRTDDKLTIKNKNVNLTGLLNEAVEIGLIYLIHEQSYNYLYSNSIKKNGNVLLISTHIRKIGGNYLVREFETLNQVSSSKQINSLYLIDGTGWYDLLISSTNSLSCSGELTFTINKQSIFKPNWCVDLKTGKMIAGLGNFVVNSDGSVVAANGNFIVDGSGNLTIKGELNNGLVNIAKSTIKPKVSFFVSNHASGGSPLFLFKTQLDDGTLSPEFLYYKGTKYYKPNELNDISGAKVCAPFSDTIISYYISFDDIDDGKNVIPTIMLPGAESMKGRTITIFILRLGNGNTCTLKISSVDGQLCNRPFDPSWNDISDVNTVLDGYTGKIINEDLYSTKLTSIYISDANGYGGSAGWYWTNLE